MATNSAPNEPTAASGKVLQGQGIGTASAFSTATYPSTATGTGKILRADGTNWVATTATYPDTAGTSGNVLTSDGTNWVSSAAGGAGLFNGGISTTGGNPVDSTTYYFEQSSGFITNTTVAGVNTHFYTPSAVTINKIYGSFKVAGTLGSNENCTLFIRVNDTSNTNISTSIQLTSASVTFNTTTLGLALSAGDWFVFGFTGPAWTTNPTTVSIALAFSS